jgi:hypothetical protein
MHQQKLQLGCTEIFRIFGLARKIALYAMVAHNVSMPVLHAAIIFMVTRNLNNLPYLPNQLTTHSLSKPHAIHNFYKAE